MDHHNSAIAELAETIGQALLQFAEQVRAQEEPTAGASPSPDMTRVAMGASQVKVFEALVRAGDRGLTAKEAADAADLHATNTHQILDKLRERGLATATGERPRVWRAVAGEH